VVNIEDLSRKCILARKEYVPGKPVEEVQRELGLNDIIKMASNENPLGSSPMAIEAMILEILRNSNRYPESLCHDLAIRLAEIHKIKADQIFIDNGLDGVITMIGLTFINPGDEVIFGKLSFPAYENITTKMDGKCVTIPMTPDYRIDINGVIAAITQKTKMIFLCNPNNPTGTINTRQEFERLLAVLPKTVILVSDEAYYDYADSADYPHTLDYFSTHNNLIIMRTFSKVMGLAGLRVGYAIAHEALVKLMLKAREPFPVNRIAQAGALASLDDVGFVARTLKTNREGREQYNRAFQAMGLKYYPSQANFVFVDIGQPGQSVFEKMLQDGVIVRPVNSADATNCLRITIGTRDENNRTLVALAKAIGKKVPSLVD
jgi:histidinol-phosphate aminotransferase